jgi:hypothetical protein
MYGYGYRYNSGLVVGAGGGAPFSNTYSLDFDGVDHYVDCGNSAALKPNIITVSCWIKGSANSAFTRIISQDGPTGGADAYGFYVTTATNKIVFAIKTNVTGTVTSATSGVVLDNNWHHLVGTYDGSEVILYVDGLAVGSPSPGTSVLSYGSGNLTIGCFSEPTSLPSFLFNGNIDEVSIFNSIIPIGDLWDGSGAPTDLSLLSTPPLNWYRMGDNGSYKSPQWLLPSNENKDKVSNYSFQFDGLDDYISLDSPNYPNAISFSAWFKTTNTSTQTIWSALDNSVQKHFLRISNTQFRLRLMDSAGALLTLDNTLTTQDGNWHHVAFTTDGTTATDGVVVYFDGVDLSNKGTLANNGLITTNKNNIGTYAATTWNFNGNIDELSLYNSELSASQISDIYNSGTPTTLPSGAVAHYKMGEEATFSGGLWTVPDQAGSNNGTSNAMTIEDRVGDAPNSENNALSYNMDEVDRVTDTP